MNNYSETIEYLFSRLPMFHRVGAIAYKADLNNIIALSNHLDHPEKKFKSIHVAGTNGKGSTSNMIASVMQEAGYKTGLFTSPHLKDFRERIRINGEMIGEKEVIDFVEKHRSTFNEINPSFFEWSTALAFNFFAQQKVDIAVIETGLGGRLDSTNILTPELSVITNISFDHMQLLGDTLEKIAFEKAGIIKNNIPVVIGERQIATENVFIQKAKEMNSTFYFASDHFKSGLISQTESGQKFKIQKDGKIIFDQLEIDLSGNYQEKNICTVLQSLEILKNNFSNIKDENISAGLKDISANTGFKGRWQILGEKPLIIADVGHNQSGIRYVMDQLHSLVLSRSKFKSQISNSVQHSANVNLYIVFGMVNDKEPSNILSLLPESATYFFCKADIPRAMDASELKNKASEYNLNGYSYPSVKSAFLAAKKNAKEDDIIFVGGSTFVVAEIL